jgi:hypothetical protein
VQQKLASEGMNDEHEKQRRNAQSDKAVAQESRCALAVIRTRDKEPSQKEEKAHEKALTKA